MQLKKCDAAMCILFACVMMVSSDGTMPALTGVSEVTIGWATTEWAITAGVCPVHKWMGDKNLRGNSQWSPSGLYMYIQATSDHAYWSWADVTKESSAGSENTYYNN
eukprot:1160026-Pelagomonas_calceolata.AAC.10